MDEQLNLLIQLQEIDGKLRALVDQKKRLPEILAEFERRRAANQANLDEVKDNLQIAQKNKRDRDQDLEIEVQKVEKLKAHTSGIKNNKEYQALLKEIEAAEQANKVIEDDILSLMEKIDAASASIVVAEKHSRAEEEALQAEQQKIESEFTKTEEDLKSIEQSRQDFVTRIEPMVYARYQKLIGTKAGIAITEVRGESCSGCYMSIPPQVFVNVKKNENIITCPNCGRILYFKDAIMQKNI
jgi:predicted  nucleic acid-binding Zn-ribbon protein